MIISYHSESLDAAVLDCAEEEPGRAVEQSEDPAADDDAPSPSQGANVLRVGESRRDNFIIRLKLGVFIRHFNSEPNQPIFHLNFLLRTHIMIMMS